MAASKSNNDGFPKPKFIEGGCLCGAVRYRVDFTDEHDFIHSSGSCQCTQCRRQTGSLLFPWHHTRAPHATFQLTNASTPALAHYKRSPDAKRGFCSACGSFLYWALENGDTVSIALGTVDPLYLWGEGADGVEVPKGGYAKALAHGVSQHLYCGNEIPGVTDDMPWLKKGPRFQGDSRTELQ